MICDNCKILLSNIHPTNESSCRNIDCIIYFISSSCVRTTDFSKLDLFIKNTYPSPKIEDYKIYVEIQFSSQKEYEYDWEAVYFIRPNKEDFQDTILKFIKKYEYFYLLG